MARHPSDPTYRLDLPHAQVPTNSTIRHLLVTINFHAAAVCRRRLDC